MLPMAVTSPQEQIKRKENDYLERTLREWREVRGMTLEEVANAVGVSATAVSYWETGKRNPVKFKTLMALRKALKLTKKDSIIALDGSTLI